MCVWVSRRTNVVTVAIRLGMNSSPNKIDVLSVIGIPLVLLPHSLPGFGFGPCGCIKDSSNAHMALGTLASKDLAIDIGDTMASSFIY